MEMRESQERRGGAPAKTQIIILRGVTTKKGWLILPLFVSLNKVEGFTLTIINTIYLCNVCINDMQLLRDTTLKSPRKSSENFSFTLLIRLSQQENLFLPLIAKSNC
jgi:hypothetical protein